MMPDYLSIARSVLPQDPVVQPVERLEDVLRGIAIELWSEAAGQIFVVAEEADAETLGERRGFVYTAEEVRRVVEIADPALVLEIHRWKRQFDGRVREVERAESAKSADDDGGPAQ